MNKIQSFLSGKKTYIVSALLVLVSLVNFLTGDLTLIQFLQDPSLAILLSGLGLASLRASK